MVVDDNDRFVKTITRFLEKACSVSVALTASSAEDAIERIGSAQPDFLLLDVQLPGISGIEAIPFLKENSPDTCIIMVTNTGPEYRDQALERGADAFVSKSQVAQELPLLLTPKIV